VRHARHAKHGGAKSGKKKRKKNLGDETACQTNTHTRAHMMIPWPGLLARETSFFGDLIRCVKTALPPRSSARAPYAENIKTTTPLVKKAREGVMEFLLINHPLVGLYKLNAADP
jgi:hypothetical protein